MNMGLESKLCRYIYSLYIISEPTMPSTIPGVSPGEGTNFARLFTPGGKKSISKAQGGVKVA